MVRRSVLAMFAVMAIVFGCVVVSTPAGAVVDSATIVPSPNAGTIYDQVSSVTCVSASWCVAVGHAGTNGSRVTLIEMWNGTDWSVVSSPSAEDGDSVLSSVSCLSMTSCTAVGDTTRVGPRNSLVEVWNGTEWSIVSSPVAGSFRQDVLNSVSCVSASDCVAVGFTWGGGITETLVMVWNGSVWSTVSSPNVGTIDDSLYSVSCVSASNCVAVGYTNTGSAYETLVEVWNGSVWSIVSSPNAGTIDDELRSVSCVSASDCVAVGVGYTDTGSGYETLVEVWNGRVWSIVSSPNVEYHDLLYSVSCVSASDCVAVGYTNTTTEYDNTGGTNETLVMVWNGSVWSIVSSPNAGTYDDELYSVSCVSVSACVAVGRTYTGPGDETLVLSLTGPVPPSTTTTTVAPDPVVPAFTG